LPLIRSFRIELYFSVAVARKPGAPPTRIRGKLAREPTGPTGPFAYMARTATAFTERRYETAVRTRFLRKRLRKRIPMNGNVTLETRH